MMYVIAQAHEDGFLLLTMDQGVIAFEDKYAAEDFMDEIDEPGEFEAIPYESSMGPMVVAI
jgi:hypothetical protein